MNRDLRCPNNSFSRFSSHKQEVCGLKWSFDGTQLASGGNDNKLMLWSLHSNQPIMKSSAHAAAVKAIAWSPHQNNLLASGGGTADRCIRFWNTSTLTQTNCVDTGSQVCNLVFSHTSNELVSTHGYSLNQINVWKLPTMSKLATLTGHTYRVLYLSLSPDGQNIVTGAGDETLRFWNIFPPLKNMNEMSSLFPSNMDIR
jgi:cell division cycle 20-like protein 1 (cofactor of APC complex)